ncbi:MAG TPA: D-aminoacyl-tRNA deacylase, partial [Bacteroidales bacterium]|nr:D-aminoacyl-tRNA deacylase [Bacteroidales bacterium]
SSAEVNIGGVVRDAIGPGLLILAGIESEDGDEDAEWLARKVTQLRIFPDDEGIMNRSVVDAGGEVMVISQFTLHALTKKGNRPSYIRAARPEQAVPMYEAFIRLLEEGLGARVARGEFGAMMDIRLVNTGPVTIIIDSKHRE